MHAAAKNKGLSRSALYGEDHSRATALRYLPRAPHSHSYDCELMCNVLWRVCPLATANGSDEVDMRIHLPAAVAALITFSTSVNCQPHANEHPRLSAVADTSTFVDLLALMSGDCKTLKIAGRDFGCRTVAYAHGNKGRVYFSVAVDDPSDDKHVVSFSGENGKRADDNSYELPIDRMLLNSKERPKVSGLPAPAEEISTGLCRQTGNFAAKKVKDVTCSAIDSEGRRYELLFVSDGTPVNVRRIRQSAPSIQDPFN